MAKLRKAGRIPAVIYGTEAEPQTLEVAIKDLDNIIKHHASETLLLDLKVDSDARPQRLALLQEVQHHPLSGKVLHVDFHEVSPDKPVTISVPVESSGEPVGVKTGGGVLEHVRHTVRLKALPKDLPEQLVVDVTALEVGRAIHIGDIQPPSGVELLDDKDQVVLSCAAPRVEEEPAADEEVVGGEAASAEVEMIKEKKDETDGDKPAAEDGGKGQKK